MSKAARSGVVTMGDREPEPQAVYALRRGRALAKVAKGELG